MQFETSLLNRVDAAATRKGGINYAIWFQVCDTAHEEFPSRQQRGE
jgi:hypothetical protein